MLSNFGTASNSGDLSGLKISPRCSVDWTHILVKSTGSAGETKHELTHQLAWDGPAAKSKFGASVNEKPLLKTGVFIVGVSARDGR